MPHKRNPVLCALIKTAALRMHGHLSVISNATAQPFERALEQWHASWVPLTEGMALIAGAVSYLKTLLQGLQVYPERMAANLDLNSDAYLRKNLENYFAANKDEFYPLINRASQETHRQHKGFVSIFSALLLDQSINVNDHHELKTILSPLSYCGAAQRQCQTILKAIEDITSKIE